MTFESPKRFIAGAVCPHCGAMDKLRMYRQDEQLYRDCVGCGFEECIESGDTARDAISGQRIEIGKASEKNLIVKEN